MPAKLSSAQRRRTALARAAIPDTRPTTPASKPKRPASGPARAPRHGFVSKKQWRWAFASKQPWARATAHKTAGGKKLRYDRLPPRKRAPTARTAR